jgi:hypothetical protein
MDEKRAPRGVETHYSTSYVARTLAGIAAQADTLRTLGIEVPLKSDCLWMRLPNGQQFRAWVQEVQSTDPDYRYRGTLPPSDHNWVPVTSSLGRPLTDQILCERCAIPRGNHGVKDSK